MRYLRTYKPIAFLFILTLALVLLVTSVVSAQSTIPGSSIADINLEDCLPNEEILAKKIAVKTADGEYLQAVSQLKGPDSLHATVECAGIPPTDFLADHWEDSRIELDDVQVLCLKENGVLSAENVFLRKRINPVLFTITLRGLIVQHGTCYLFFLNPELVEEDVEMGLEREDMPELSPGGISG